MVMRRGFCRRHGGGGPCTCAMGNVYRFLEPVLLLMLREEGRSYGYDLAGKVSQYALTDAEIERGALYRTLRQLEENGHVVSEWDLQQSGPARRVYSLTPAGQQHLRDWGKVLGNLAQSMSRFSETVETKPVKS